MSKVTLDISDEDNITFQRLVWLLIRHKPELIIISQKQSAAQFQTAAGAWTNFRSIPISVKGDQ